MRRCYVLCLCYVLWKGVVVIGGDIWVLEEGAGVLGGATKLWTVGVCFDQMYSLVLPRFLYIL